MIREARRRAGLSQRELARRAGISQSVVARIERRITGPSWDMLARLVTAAGFEIQAGLAVRPASDSHMLDDVGRILRLTPDQRLEEVRNAARFLATVRCG